MYAIATIPLIRKLRSLQDDASAAGKLSKLRDWWSELSTLGKCNQVTKDKHLATATSHFANTGVQITSEGRPYLGAAIGSHNFVVSHVKACVAK